MNDRMIAFSEPCCCKIHVSVVLHPCYGHSDGLVVWKQLLLLTEACIDYFANVCLQTFILCLCRKEFWFFRTGSVAAHIVVQLVPEAVSLDCSFKVTLDLNCLVG